MKSNYRLLYWWLPILVKRNGHLFPEVVDIKRSNHFPLTDKEKQVPTEGPEYLELNSMRALDMSYSKQTKKYSKPTLTPYPTKSTYEEIPVPYKGPVSWQEVPYPAVAEVETPRDTMLQKYKPAFFKEGVNKGGPIQHTLVPNRQPVEHYDRQEVKYIKLYFLDGHEIDYYSQFKNTQPFLEITKCVATYNWSHWYHAYKRVLPLQIEERKDEERVRREEEAIRQRQAAPLFGNGLFATIIRALDYITLEPAPRRRF